MMSTNCLSPSSVKRSCAAAVLDVPAGPSSRQIARAAAPGDAGRAATSTPSKRPALPTARLRGRQVEDRDGGRAERLDRAEARDADDRGGLRRAVRRRSRTRVADARCCFSAVPASMHDLAGAGGPAAVVEAERGEAARRPRRGASRPTPKYGPVADGLAVGADDLGARRVMSPAATATPRHVPDAVERSTARDRRLPERCRCRLHVERGRRADDGVGAVVGGGGQRVGGAAHRVGEREGAARSWRRRARWRAR